MGPVTPVGPWEEAENQSGQSGLRDSWNFQDEGPPQGLSHNFGGPGWTHLWSRSPGGTLRPGGSSITLLAGLPLLALGSRLAISTLGKSHGQWSTVSGHWGHWDGFFWGAELTGGPANPAGPGAPGSPRSPCRGNGVKIKGMGKMQHRQHCGGTGGTYGGTAGTGGSRRARRAGLALERKEGELWGMDGSAPGVGWVLPQGSGGIHLGDRVGSVPVGAVVGSSWSHLLAVGASRAGGADGTGQTLWGQRGQ